ncbi:hypothetical protein NM688_g3662 [Phlebia brevispora]|uniref:Uncharacterized protein n=1 Tax=Phlebia brevispora TaxID=194682 RepID=A0ACC1T5S0_9APHY|nr:hypothetical protein NM688_g3662 [Phlebia brevispora]
MTTTAVVPACLLAAVPVVQPPHLEGDASLATEILPGPPPLASVQQVGLPRKDHKKTFQATSYLPISDPGTTYGANTVSTMAAAATEVDGPRRKRARLDKVSASSRSQRASARNNHVAKHTPELGVPMEGIASSSHLAVESDGAAMQVDSDDAMLSRSNSVQLPDDGENDSSSRRSTSRRDKGKGKEKERGLGVRVKEEPAAVSLNANESNYLNTASNEDHCSSCRSLGSLIYCDGCPRAFHLLCLDPPMEPKDLPAGDVRWFCPACMLKQKPPPKPPSSLKFMAPLIEHVQSIIPVEYQLPQDIRTFFKDVATGPKGTYEDSSEFKVARLNRHGQLEERDPYRLKDRNGDPVICFRCGTSALPPSLAATSPSTKRQRRTNGAATNNEAGRSIISCDYCHLHWHLDCLDPPLAYMPPWNRKWMCPNHADRVLQPKHRIPKNNAPPIEVSKSGQWNNGNIEVIQPETTIVIPPKLHVEEVLINGRRYRVPERIITMDFWNKTGKDQTQQQSHTTYESGMSSPLTSLSGYSDDESESQSSPSVKTFDMDQLRAAMSLCGLRASQAPSAGGDSSKIAKITKQRSAEPKTLKQDTQIASKTPAPDVVKTETNGVSQPEVAAPMRRSSRRPRPAKGYIYAEDYAELSEDSREYVQPEHTSRRQKRDANGKFVRKSDRSYHHHGHKAASSVAPSESTVSGTPTTQASSLPPLPEPTPTPSKSATMKSTPERFDVCEEQPVPAATASRPKRTRVPSRRADSPMTLTSASTQTNGNAQSRAPVLNVPAPTSLHPSLRYKPTASSTSETLSKVGTPRGSATSKAAKQATPAPAMHKAAPSSMAGKAEPTTTPSTGLKIRLPRISTVLPPVVSSTPDVEMSSGKTQSSSEVRPRRSLRRQRSVSTSMTGTSRSRSTPSSPRANGLA